ncbi:cell growth-regulating nucleolar protein-like [Saccoglossus kowalevskii]|uniref:Cell growth-regulating nucleolar protein-like n=1 Tax=Saccoglossus kowalevskii TaxID=10224 RepID=A0ABM0GVR9_SACKO|nr:PREDICTED: cell growth-regulating nucleolar protein-like [Saccoglossus kowalevskii]
MVFFNCNACGQTVKKNQVEKHYQTQCPRCEVLSCLDCGKEFFGDDYQEHTKCITEDTKYGSMENRAVNSKPKKGEIKQENWIQRVKDASNNVSVPPRLRNLLLKITEYPNVPRKKAKFVNFLKNSLRVFDLSTSEQLWEIFSSANSKQENDLMQKPSILNSGCDVVGNGKEVEQNSNDDLELEKTKKKKKKDKMSEDLDDKKTEQTDDSYDISHKKKKKKRKIEDSVAVVNDDDDEDVESTKSKKKKRKKMKHLLENEDHNDIVCDEEDNNTKKKKRKNKKDEQSLHKNLDSVDGEGSKFTDMKPGKRKQKHEKSEKVSPSKKHKKIMENDDEEENAGNKFHWESMIKKVLKSSDANELPIKKLRKKVINEFWSQNNGGKIKTREEVLAVFNHKIHHSNKFKVFKDRVKLAKKL